MKRRNNTRIKEYFIEFIIVILGITIAFWLTNQSELRKEKRLEKAYLKQLLDDLNQDIESFNITTKFNKNKTASLNECLIYIVEHQGMLSADTIAKYALQVGNYNFFYPSNHTYLTLQQSGDLRLLQSQKLKKNLVVLYQSYNLIKNEQDNLIQALDDNFFPELYTNVDMITGRVTNKKYFTTTQCTNFLAFTKQQTQQLIRQEEISKRLAQETSNLIITELGLTQTSKSEMN